MQNQTLLKRTSPTIPNHFVVGIKHTKSVILSLFYYYCQLDLTIVHSAHTRYDNFAFEYMNLEKCCT